HLQTRTKNTLQNPPPPAFKLAPQTWPTIRPFLNRRVAYHQDFAKDTNCLNFCKSLIWLQSSLSVFVFESTPAALDDCSIDLPTVRYPQRADLRVTWSVTIQEKHVCDSVVALGDRNGFLVEYGNASCDTEPLEFLLQLQNVLRSHQVS